MRVGTLKIMHINIISSLLIRNRKEGIMMAGAKIFAVSVSRLSDCLQIMCQLFYWEDNISEVIFGIVYLQGFILVSAGIFVHMGGQEFLFYIIVYQLYVCAFLGHIWRQSFMRTHYFLWDLQLRRVRFYLLLYVWQRLYC